ncbi:hypothetical protein EZV62_005157 [Acer yangbiense]|uniref:3'-5' exonuclease domain-containing protein n=1 Tax=Acer yangbiense TaxID=1000413 RepID=A0A5C7IP44_9ROSI|nr:hypothetical protein EZV62_005157 [Acer yangbiense]
MTVTIFDHKVSSSTHNIYDVNFFDDSIRTLVTNCPSMVESWMSEIKLIHQQRLGRLIVGLDIEHHPNFNYKNEHPVATLQLCVGHRCLIFQMIHAPDIPQCLEDFLLNDKYSFVGVKVDEDAEKLKNDYNLSVGNAIDLRTLAAEHVEVLGMNMKELKQAGLKGLSERILGKKLEKPKKIQLSNWDDRKLSSDQVQYACLDAFVSFEIARTLKKNPASFISSSQPRSFVQKAHSTMIMIEKATKTIEDISDHLTLHHANYQSGGSTKSQNWSTGSGSNQATGGSRKNYHCTHCDMDGHSIERCFFIHGFPPGHRFHGKDIKPKGKKPIAHNSLASTNAVSEPQETNIITFIAEEYEKIMALFCKKDR